MTLASNFLMAFILLGLVAAIGIGAVITLSDRLFRDADALDESRPRDPSARR